MQVSNVLSGLSNASALANGKQPGSVGGQAATAAAQAGGVPNATSAAAVQGILSQYDMTHITPNEFSQMVQKLAAAGAISPQDQQTLAGVRGDLDAARVGADEATNLIDFYNEKVQDVQAQTKNADPTTQQQQLTPVMQRFEWLQKLQVMKNQPAATGLSALA